ncbi:hypothetical protein MMC19_005174 [Ptychographa xylographoides]|nr:hypothetical protein [Ptychographa xylographoides]
MATEPIPAHGTKGWTELHRSQVATLKSTNSLNVCKYLREETQRHVFKHNTFEASSRDCLSSFIGHSPFRRYVRKLDLQIVGGVEILAKTSRKDKLTWSGECFPALEMMTITFTVVGSSEDQAVLTIKERRPQEGHTALKIVVKGHYRSLQLSEMLEMAVEKPSRVLVWQNCG